MDLLEFIRDTPLPTLLVLIGIVSLSVGFGLKIKAAFDVESINRTYAKTIGVIFLLLGLMPYLSNISLSVNTSNPYKVDPFLIYYTISVPIVVVFFGLASKYSSGEAQVRFLKASFIFVGSLILFVVLWRAIDIYFFVTSEGGLGEPMGLYPNEKSNFLPYMILLSAGIGVILWLFYINTKQPDNIANRMLIFQNFSLLCLYLAVCRLIWELLSYVARIKVPPPQ